MKKIETQYDLFSKTYSENINDDEKSIKAFYNEVDFELKGKKLLDIGCGSGEDIAIFTNQGAVCSGIDPSKAFVVEAQVKNPTATITEGIGETLPIEENRFDIVTSKWALQTSKNISQILEEVARVLKPGGILLYLSKHPWQQWMEKVRDYGHGADYYEQKMVTSNIYAGKISLTEPTHTISDYFNNEFYSNFEMINYVEGTDFPASEQITRDIYPTFFIVKARKKI